MPLSVPSAVSANGNEHGVLLSFDDNSDPPGVFGTDGRIADPCGLTADPKQRLLFVNSAGRVLGLDACGKVMRDAGVIAARNLRGEVFGPVGGYYVRLRGARTILALSPDLHRAGEHVPPAGIMPFPRGFGFDAEGRLFLASGTGPNGQRDDAIVAFAPADRARPSLLVEHDPDLGPLDLTVAPNGDVVVSSESPFGAPDAVTTPREYDSESGRLVRVFWPAGMAVFRKPRGLRFDPDGHLYRQVAQMIDGTLPDIKRRRGIAGDGSDERLFRRVIPCCHGATLISAWPPRPRVL